MTDRRTDLERHLDDLRTRSHEGRTSWEEKAELFAEEVDRLDPFTRQALQELSQDWLDDTGEVSRTDTTDDPEGHLVTRWSLSWPDQQAAAIAPVQIVPATRPGGCTRTWALGVPSPDSGSSRRA